MTEFDSDGSETPSHTSNIIPTVSNNESIQSLFKKKYDSQSRRGRKKVADIPSSRRAAQNRENQRALRLRKQLYVEGLEHKITELELQLASRTPATKPDILPSSNSFQFPRNRISIMELVDTLSSSASIPLSDERSEVLATYKSCLRAIPALCPHVDKLFELIEDKAQIEAHLSFLMESLIQSPELVQILARDILSSLQRVVEQSIEIPPSMEQLNSEDSNSGSSIGVAEEGFPTFVDAESQLHHLIFAIERKK